MSKYSYEFKKKVVKEKAVINISPSNTAFLLIVKLSYGWIIISLLEMMG